MARQVADIKNPGGRPRTGIGTFIGVRLNPVQLTALDSWRSKHPAKPNRPEAIRIMIGEATASNLQKVQSAPPKLASSEVLARRKALADAREAALPTASDVRGILKLQLGPTPTNPGERLKKTVKK